MNNERDDFGGELVVIGSHPSINDERKTWFSHNLAMEAVAKAGTPLIISLERDLANDPVALADAVRAANVLESAPERARQTGKSLMHAEMVESAVRTVSEVNARAVASNIFTLMRRVKALPKRTGS